LESYILFALVFGRGSPSALIVRLLYEEQAELTRKKGREIEFLFSNLKNSYLEPSSPWEKRSQKKIEAMVALGNQSALPNF